MAALSGATRVRAPATWDRLAYESQPFAKKVASALALFAPLGTKLAHSARVRTIKHRLARWRPLACPRRAAPMAAKECFGERTTKPVTQKKRSARVARAVHTVARRHCACGPHSGCLSSPESGGVQKCARVTFPAHPLSLPLRSRAVKQDCFFTRGEAKQARVHALREGGHVYPRPRCSAARS